MMLDWKMGEYYFAIRCKSCDVEFAFLQDGQTHGAVYLTDRCEMVITCPDCYFPMAYSGKDVKRFQAE